MLHARKDYRSIQISGDDPEFSPTIGADEPVFLLRAKDALAPATLEFWADELSSRGGDAATVNHVHAWADLMRRWQAEHGNKIPDADESVHESSK